MQSVVAPLCEAVLFGWHLREGVRASVAESYFFRLIEFVLYLCSQKGGFSLRHSLGAQPKSL